MNPRALVRPLEPRWQDVLDAALAGVARPALSTKDVARLAPKVKELSQAYNTGTAEGKRTKLPLEARIAFSFPRDVPKGAGAVRELVASDVLAIPRDRPLRVLDLGAGLGAMTWGLVRALAASGAKGQVEALLVDEDAEVLRGAEAIARAARSMLDTSSVELTVTTRTCGVAAALADASTGRYDIVILGQVLSEIDPRSAPDERLELQSSMVARLMDACVANDGALVIVEPALRDRTRHLHALRDRVLDGARAPGGIHVFAPCLHDAICPALAELTEWCHEDLPVDLPPWVASLARAAGLRWQGLTFSYLVLRRDGRLPVQRVAPDDRGMVRFRMVSDLLRSKGKIEAFTCAEAGARQRIRHLDRDTGHGTGVPFAELERGDIVTLSTSPASATTTAETDLSGPIDARGRVRPDAHVAIDVGTGRS